MNAEKLLEYLRDESHLYSLNYHEFKSLVMQYPYCQNLRVLLVKKAQIDGQKDLERDQQLAAAYVTDRRFLHKKMKELETQLQQNNIKMQVSEHIILTEDSMELSALSDLEKMITDRHITEVFAVP